VLAHQVLLAARGSAWGGVVVGLVAAGLFVVFSGWIVVQRVRHGAPARQPVDEERRDG